MEPRIMYKPDPDSNFERWFNELTHKYLEYVRRCHLECVKEPLQFDVRELFEKIKLAKEIDGADLEEFAHLLRTAIEELDSEISHDERKCTKAVYIPEDLEKKVEQIEIEYKDEPYLRRWFTGPVDYLNTPKLPKWGFRNDAEYNLHKNMILIINKQEVNWHTARRPFNVRASEFSGLTIYGPCICIREDLKERKIIDLDLNEFLNFWTA